MVLGDGEGEGSDMDDQAISAHIAAIEKKTRQVEAAKAIRAAQAAGLDQDAIEQMVQMELGQDLAMGNAEAPQRQMDDGELAAKLQAEEMAEARQRQGRRERRRRRQGSHAQAVDPEDPRAVYEQQAQLEAAAAREQQRYR